jgi:carbon monoxide dehydrogenase subunit G
MRLEGQFTVGASLDRVWRVVSDPGVFAACLPQSDLQFIDDTYAGRVTWAGNGGQIRCEALLRAVDEDEDEHAATILLQGRQLDGPGIGSITVRSHCEPADSATRVSVSAELVSSGHPGGEEARAQARRVFEEVTAALEAKAAAPPRQPISEAPPPSPREPISEAPPPSVAVAEPSGSAAVLQTGRTLPRQAGLLAGALIALWLISWLFGRRRSGRW